MGDMQPAARARTVQLRATYRKPVIWDEVQYEGDIPQAWGALSAEEMADRFWWAASLGVYAGHSETLLRRTSRRLAVARTIRLGSR